MVANRKKQTDLPGKNPDQSIGLVADSTENATMSQDKFVFKQDSRETEAGRRGKFQEMFHQTERKASQTANRGEKGAGAHTQKGKKMHTEKGGVGEGSGGCGGGWLLTVYALCNWTERRWNTNSKLLPIGNRWVYNGLSAVFNVGYGGHW